MTTPTIPDQARELVKRCVCEGWHDMGDAFASLSDQIETALQDRVALAMQVESLTKNLDGHKTQAAEDFALINSLTAERNQAIEAGHAAVEMCEKLLEERDADKKQIRELDAELGDAKIAIQAAQSCTTHYCDLLKTREADLDRLKKQPPIAYLAWRDGQPCWDDDCVCEDAVYPVDEDDDRTSKAVYLSAGAQPDTKELAELRADAERYRWLRSVGGQTWHIVDDPKNPKRAVNDYYDAAVDDAKAAS